MKRTPKRTPKRSALPQKMTALFLTLVLLLPLFCFGMYTFAEETEPEILYEDMSKRSETEKHFVCSDGSGIAVSYGQAVHQPDGKGGFEDLDNRLILNSETRRYENTGNRRFSVSLATTSAGQPVTVQAESAPVLSLVTRVMKNGLTLSPELFPFGLQAEVGSANAFCGQKVADATFELGSFVTSLTSSTAYGLFSGISSKYTLVGNGLKEEIILERNTGVVGFQTEYTVAGLTAAANGDGSLSFFDPAGQTVYSVSSPYVFDAAGSVCPAVAVLLRQTVTGYAVTYTPDAAWLSSGERVYPITFDPLVSNGTLNGNLLTAKTYTDNGTTVTETNGQLSVGFDKSVTPVGRTYTSLYISSLGYPSVNTDYYEVQSLTLTLTIKEKTGVSGLYNYRLGAGENPLSVGFEPSGERFSTNVVSQTSTTTAVSLPLDYYETGSTPTYLLMPRIRTTDSGTKSVSYYGPAESDRQKRPVLKVSYSLRENFDEKVGFISRTDGGVTRYLGLNENNSLAVSTTPYRWIFEEYLTGYGDYVIRSFEDSDYCLKAGTNNTVTAVTYPVLPQEPSTSHFWSPVLHDSALETYLFYSNAGGGFLHLNTADGTLTLSSSSGIDEHAWVVQAFHIDGSSDEEISLGVFTFRNGEYTSQYMAIEGAYNYNIDDSNVSSLILSNNTQYGDQGAFRLIYVPSKLAYRLAPICSGNGYYRVVSKSTSSDFLGINQLRSTNENYQLFNILYWSDGSIGFQMKGTTNVLTAVGGTIQLIGSDSSDLSSHWNVSEYVYSYNEMIALYDEVERYYKNLNFQSPFGENGPEMRLTSGFGPRGVLDVDSNTIIPYTNGSSEHKGIDLSASIGTNLYSPFNGTVVYISNDYSGSAGKRIVIRLDTPRQNGNYFGDKALYVVYMHMDSINTSLTVGSVLNEETGWFVGKSGASGNNSMSGYPEHLHVAVFQADYDYSSINFNNSPWTYVSCKLNPLLFFVPDIYAVTLERK